MNNLQDLIDVRQMGRNLALWAEVGENLGAQGTVRERALYGYRKAFLMEG